MIIYGLQKSSLIDYPSKIAAVIFTGGCNFRCPFCHNGSLINKDSAHCVEINEILNFLKNRKGKLDGVVISGGEPTIHNDLEEIIKQIKKLGYKIKLDTNGTNPKMVETLIRKKLINYVAMDLKAPLDKYSEITCTQVDTDKIKQSINLLLKNYIEYEFRTTVVKECLSFKDFEIMAKEIKGAKKYYLQTYIPELAYDETFKNKTTYSTEDLKKIKKIFENNVEKIYIR